MSKPSHRKKIGFDFRWLFGLCILGGAFYFIPRFNANSAVLVFPIGLVAFGVIGLIVASLIKHFRRDSFEYFSPPEIIQMKMPTDWRSAYESLATFLVGRWGSGLFAAGWYLLMIIAMVTRGQTILGLSLGRVVLGYFFGYIALTMIGSFLGWEEMVERKHRERKLKPIPERGEKVELYDFETGRPLAHISGTELKFLIDSFHEWGMADNDFYIMSETVDLFEEQGADAHLVATLRQMMGKKHEMEIGWTLV
ncbi:MAG TPA: hypothetical protein VKD91_01755 [Pyrinomonadaceae bacterium]|nr:hypothetical protein [Pyrinomonadaceae bacterium]